MQLFPEKIIKFWNGWEVRVLVLLSLLLQIILTFFGARRKHTARIWIRMLVWSAYLTADWVATVALGNLTSSQEDYSEDSSQQSNNNLQTFWVPFLLLHLGGPDTITAYSLEDNELWLRHLLGLGVQVGLAFYIFVRSWSNSALTYVTIPVFITGMIKYGERTFVLRSSSSQYLKNILLSDPDPGPDFIEIQKQRERKPRSGAPFCACLCGPDGGTETDSDIDEARKQPPGKATVLPPESLKPGAWHPRILPKQETPELQQKADYQQQQQPSEEIALPPETDSDIDEARKQPTRKPTVLPPESLIPDVKHPRILLKQETPELQQKADYQQQQQPSKGIALPPETYSDIDETRKQPPRKATVLPPESLRSGAKHPRILLKQETPELQQKADYQQQQQPSKGIALPPETDSDIDEAQKQPPRKATVLPSESLRPGAKHPRILLKQETPELQQNANYQQQQQPSKAIALPLGSLEAPISPAPQLQQQPSREMASPLGSLEAPISSAPQLQQQTSTEIALPLESLEAPTSPARPTETSAASLFSTGRRRRRGARRQRQQHLITVTVLPPETLKAGANYLQVAYFLFKRFRYLFASLILSYYEREESYSKIINMSADDAFKLVAVELGFMYDVLYTKATIVYSLFGILFRFISFCCSVSALIAFSIVIDTHSYPLIDISISYILMIGAVVLEIYAFTILLFSDWTKLCLTNRSDGCCHCQANLSRHKRWSESIAQHNLISSCLQNVQPIWSGIQNLPWIGELLEKYGQYLTWKDVNVDLQNIIFRQLLEKSNEIKDCFSIESCKKLLAHRGDNVLKNRYGLLDQFCWSISDVEFDHSLLLWHIATDLCYYSENDNKLDTKCRISKYLSDYMLYLLVFRPSMLPEGIAEIRYRDTLAECKRFFPEEKTCHFCWKFAVKRKRTIENTVACKALLRVEFGDEQEQMKGYRSQSVLFYGCRLAKQLQSLKIEDGWSRERKWAMISEVWVEMLAYAANRGRWKEHGQQLRKGGELLTHVRLLMAHLGLSEQYPIQKRFFSQPRDTLNRKVHDLWRRMYGLFLCGLLLLPCLQCYQCLRWRCCENEYDVS
ncbi:hypothetical protein ACOSP7_019992 [Xanthoceras sorbifolium]